MRTRNPGKRKTDFNEVSIGALECFVADYEAKLGQTTLPEIAKPNGAL